MTLKFGKRIQRTFRAVSFVEGFGIQLSVKNLRMVQSNRSESADFVKHLLKAICHKSPGFSEIECKQVFEHYRRVCKTILASVDDDEIVEVKHGFRVNSVVMGEGPLS